MTDDRPTDEQQDASAERADAIRSAVECAVVVVIALAIPVAFLLVAWNLAEGGYGRGIVLMSGITMAIVAAGAGITVLARTMRAGARRRRAVVMRGRCVRCGYNLEGLRSDTCPECGATRDPAIGLARSDGR